MLLLISGYEVSQGNAAFVLRKRLSDKQRAQAAMALIVSDESKMNLIYNSLFSNDSIQSEIANFSILNSKHSQHNKNNNNTIMQTYFSTVGNRLLVRQLALSSFAGNKESSFLIGSMYFEGKGIPQSCQNALWWYSKASANGYVLSSVYIGVIHHFNLCHQHHNYNHLKERNQKNNYKHNHKHDNNHRNIPRAIRYYQHALNGELDITMRLCTKALLYMTNLWTYSYTIPIATSLEYIVQFGWGSSSS